MGLEVSLKPYHKRAGILRGRVFLWLFDVLVMSGFGFLKWIHKRMHNTVFLVLLVHYPFFKPYIYIKSLPDDTEFIASVISHEEIHNILNREVQSPASKKFDNIHKIITNHVYDYPWFIPEEIL